ncbi:mannan endo-1,6-alpha-mannosidase DCW1 [Nannizzia gypsea CBS 118893]|uniref:Mannan endo-1,6-alpha-mannosidase n=1 Tax=Arthroderma gypseum (strain ATCC MYA-4604 / CBS 118893) TaxID=535722 RepID=E4V5T4_ARTGP|nr:mannan endo-1,6-alpha-mannosidase DCW1 [Nannizzia gypsea CBS 118893]EFR05459.1 mannan endo-1,6-alpha-mannosidase DCW1 [Nannizzia gypsea CBS 118893]
MALKHMPWLSSRWAILLLLLQSWIVTAIKLDLESDESIKLAAKTAAQGMMKYYTGHQPGNVPGNLPDPYYWWETGAMFGSLIDYWFYTGDSQWNDIVTEGMLWQVGPDSNFMPPNQTLTEGNDDQAFWAIAAMSAAERKFPNPPSDKPQWLSLVEAVFNSQIPRWDTTTCGGGLKWQIFRFNRGFDYKNTISNGAFFQMGARLARYTGNETYAKWAEKAWDWSRAIGLINENYQFFDGSSDTLNCTELNRLQWTYNAGIYLLGAAAMYNYTSGSPKWEERVQGILDGLRPFFHPETYVMSEISCEEQGNCETDQRSFKAYLARWMAVSTQFAPFSTNFIMHRLRACARGAAEACTGGDDGTACGLKWTFGKFDGSTGVGEQMAAMEIFQSNLIRKAVPPVTQSTGGISMGGPGGSGKGKGDGPKIPRPITGSDKAGAAILTLLMLCTLCGVSYSMAVG